MGILFGSNATWISRLYKLARLLVRGNLIVRHPEWSGNTYLERGKKSAVDQLRVRAAWLSNESHAARVAWRVYYRRNLMKVNRERELGLDRRETG